MTHRTTPLSTLPDTARAVSVLVLVLLITTLTAGMGFAWYRQVPGRNQDPRPRADDAGFFL